MSELKSPYDLTATFTVPVSCIVEGKAMSLAPNGRDAVLAGRKGLAVIDLDNPYVAPRRLLHQTSWEVADVQWSPHVSRPSWVVSTSNQKAILWNLDRPSHNAIEHYLHAHTRAITDINFYPHDPNLLSTCSVDSFVYTWDLRAPTSPVHQFADWRAAASQVKWNYLNPNILASSHDHHLLIWDIRKGALPLHRISAHNGRINGIDWSRTSEHEIITCSNDMTVKFWSINDQQKDGSHIKLQYTINTDFPVNRARHVPFGDHCCGIMPLRGGNNSIYIVKYKDKEGISKLNPSYVFKGHSEPVKDFLWRSRHSQNTSVDDRDFQLVTCSSDNELRLWPVEESMHENFNYVKGTPLPKGEKLIDHPYKSYISEPTFANENEFVIRHTKKSKFIKDRTNFSYSNHHLTWIAGVKVGPSVLTDGRNDPNSLGFEDSLHPTNLGEEVSSVSARLPKLKFEKMDFVSGNLVVSFNGPWSSENEEDLIFVRVDINIPSAYPSAHGIPKFKIEESHDLDERKQKDMLTNLELISKAYCSANRFCLDPCVRYLLGEKDVNLNFDEIDEIEEPILPTFFDPFERSNEMFYNDNDDESGHASMYSKHASTVETEDEEEVDDILTHDVHVKAPSIDNVPIPKGCGAVWTPSGHLVCFFIPKEKKKSQQDVLKFGHQGFSLGNRLKKKDNMTSLDNALSDSRENRSDDDDSSINSEDSLSNDFDKLQSDRHHRTRVPMLLRETVIGPGKFSGGAKSGTLSMIDDGSELSPKSKAVENHSMVKIYDFSDLIPAKMDLALNYRVLGDTPEKLARHNAIVANEYGYSELRDCWNLLSVILVKDFPVYDEALSNISSMSQCELKDKLYESVKRGDELKSHRFYWGKHPFGTWLATEMMKYFEKIGDIQMLAMLSCITFENGTNKLKSSVPIHTPYIVPSSNSSSDSYRVRSPTPGSSKHHSFRKMSQIQRRRAPSNISFSRRSSKSVPDLAEVSSLPMISSRHLPSISTISSYDGESKPGSYEKDNEIIRRSLREKSYKSENTIVYRHSSPSSLSVNNFSTSSLGQLLNKNNFSLESPGPNSIKFKIPKIEIQMLNVKELDLYEDVYSVNLQYSMDMDKLKSWRSEYASLLYFWGLSAGRAKILKFNYSFGKEAKSMDSESDDYKEHIGSMGWFDKKHFHGTPTPAYNWEEEKKLRKCHYCGEPVSKRITSCIICNHILHSHCAYKWWEEDEMEECPCGCGCNCLEFSHGDVSYI